MYKRFKAEAFAKKRTEKNCFKKLAVASVFVVALFPTFSSAFTYDDYLLATQKAGQSLATSIITSKDNTTTLYTQLGANVSDTFDGVLNFFSNLWKKTPPPTQPITTLPTPKPIPPKPVTSPQPTATPAAPRSDLSRTQVIVERILSGVTSQDLELKIQQLRNELVSKIGAVAGQTQSNYDNNFQAIALTNKIDQLTNTVITTPTITGGTITNASISGGTISGSTISGSLSVSSGTFSGNLTVSGTGTSTFAGDSNFDGGTLYIDSLNNRVGVGTTSPSDTLALAGPLYLSQISAPGVTTNRLYNTGGSLYWNGTALGAGGGGGTSSWATTTSQVSGQLVNYSTNATDIVAIGASSTTTAPFWFDPNTTTGYISGNLGIGTTSPYAKLSVVGETVSSYFTATSTTATSTFNGGLAVGTGASPSGLVYDRSTGRVGIGTASPGATLDLSMTIATVSAGDINYGSRFTTLDSGLLSSGSDTLYGMQISATKGGLQSSGAIINVFGVDIVATSGSGVATETVYGSNVTAKGGDTTYAIRGVLDGTYAITTGYGFKVGVVNPSGIGTAYGLHIANLSSATTANYGVYLADQGTGASKYALYSVGGQSYFGGNVGIGTSSPYAKLSVVGETVSSYFTATSTTANGFAGYGGSATFPTYSFNGDSNTGMYSTAADQIMFSAAGANRLSITTVGLTLQSGSSLLAGAGTVSLPIYSFSSDTNTGIYSPGADAIGFTTSGSERLRIDSTGNVGIGTTSPYAALSVVGETVSSYFTATSTTATSTFAGAIGIGTTSPQAKLHISNGWSGTLPNTNSDDLVLESDGNVGMSFLNSSASISSLAFGHPSAIRASGISRPASTNDLAILTGTFTETARFASTGNVGIGTTSPYAKLSVVGETVSSYFTATSTTATTTLSGGLAVGSSGTGFIYDFSTGNVSIGAGTPLTGKLNITGTVSAASGVGGINETISSSFSTGGSVYGNKTTVTLTGVLAPATNFYGNHLSINASGCTACANSYAYGYYVTFPAEANSFSGRYGYYADIANLYGGSLGVNTAYFAQLPGGSSSAVAYQANTGSSFSGKLLDLKIASASALVLNSSGNLGIGTTSPSEGLHVGSAASGKNVRIANGWLCVDNNDTCTGAATAGTVYAVGAYTTGADLAENYQAFEEGLQPGDLVSLTTENTTSTTTDTTYGVKKGTQGSSLLGIVSTKPGLLLGNGPNEMVPIALSGRVPAKVSLEGGNILPGDRITISGTPGVGMKATSSAYTVGVALEPFTASSPKDGQEIGTITVFTNVGWSRLDPAISGGTIGHGQSSFWDIDESSGRIKYIAPVDFNDFDLIGVKAIIGSAGKWSIDASGKLLVDEVEARKVTTQEITTQVFCVDDVCVDKDKLKAMLGGSVQGGGSSNIQTQPQDDKPPGANEPEQPATSTVSTTSNSDNISENNSTQTSTTENSTSTSSPSAEETQEVMTVETSSDDYASTTSEVISN